MFDKILPYEENLFFLINGSHNHFFDSIMWLFSSMKTWIPFAIIIIFYIVYKKSWKQCFSVLIAIVIVFVLCDQFSSHIIKPLFARPRPTHYPGIMEHVQILKGYTGGKYGFISGHATNSFGFAVFSTLLFRNKMYGIVIFIWAIIMSYSRIYLGVHFVSDIAGGIISGIILGGCVYGLYYFVTKRIAERSLLFMAPAYPSYQVNRLSLVIIGYVFLISIFITLMIIL